MSSVPLGGGSGRRRKPELNHVSRWWRRRESNCADSEQGQSVNDRDAAVSPQNEETPADGLGPDRDDEGG